MQIYYSAVEIFSDNKCKAEYAKLTPQPLLQSGIRAADRSANAARRDRHPVGQAGTSERRPGTPRRAAGHPKREAGFAA